MTPNPLTVAHGLTDGLSLLTSVLSVMRLVTDVKVNGEETWTMAMSILLRKVMFQE